MPLRLLLTAARAEHRLLVRKHVEIAWPDAAVVEHAFGEEPSFEPEFEASGFDAVVIVAAAPLEPLARLAIELRRRPQFAPIVFVALAQAPQGAPAAGPGLQVLQGAKIDRAALLDALAAAGRERRLALVRLRARPDYGQRHRFGSVTIRGHRCIKQVGSGGMCAVYLAESERAGRVVVLKVFSQVPDVSDKVAGFDRFIQEYEIVANLTHEHIVRIFDLGVADDHAYIAMEHFPAGDLRRRLKSPVPAETALGYIAEIASALEAIHAVGVLHRDLKPANIMLRDDDSLCLIDFGLAKAALATELTGAREIFGTPYYMSPEQGHAEAIDERSDLYSLGVVFYEMLTGQKPFRGATAMEVIYKHKRAPVPPLAPPLARYEPIIARLLAKAPADRFQSARDLRGALAALVAPA
ncbi:MAG TPA: serine/threonine-protein kinase [Steroidobacteraceae bacterium]|nr:serine/threonine-protein kinase [Steroidobacteraceae bacterium]